MSETLFGGRRYQVFLSSTFRDLIEERQQVIQTLLRINCFPVAMEHFPASYEKQWTFIRPLIENSDYFICLIAGKYGHCGSDGISFTQREFQYAVECGVPILVFYHKEPEKLPADRTEQEPELRNRLQAFRFLAQSDRLCEGWNHAHDLPALVMQSIIQIAHDCPRSGWRYRAEKSTEFLELQLRNSQLEQLLLEANGHSKNAPHKSFRNYEDAVSTIAETLDSTATLCRESEDILKIRLLGVCLHMSLPTLIRFIERAPESVRIEIRLAVLDKRSEIYRTLNHRWATLYPVFEDDLHDLVERLKKRDINKNVSIKLVRYSHMPNWHGILINYQHLFMGHCLWHDDGRLTVGQNPYDHYERGVSALHDRKIKQYVHWFDYCRKTASFPKDDYLLVDTAKNQ